ncbi:MAG TPA: hypothetical protein VM032_06940 [Vicinamibacterales bacterium]|nr:hypothetical protein [Vicinamibacterales bacterium]
MTLTATRGFGTPAVVIENAPVFLLPDTTRLPLRIAKPGSQLRVLQQTGEWANVQFDDPQYGLRTGFVQGRFLRIAEPPASGPADVAAPASSAPDTRPRRSESSGLFVGGGFVWDRIMPNDATLGSDASGGPGVGFVAGFGMSQFWSIYGGVSVARLEAAGVSDTGTLTHVDIGTRLHLASAARRATPFLQVGLSQRSVSQNFTDGTSTHSVSASGPGLSFGGGVNVHITPALAVSGTASWMSGDFSTYEVDGRTLDGDAFGATSGRIQIGMVWFPRGAR